MKQLITLHHNDDGHVFGERKGVWDGLQIRVSDGGDLIIAQPGNCALGFDREQARNLIEHLTNYLRLGVLHPADPRLREDR